jgi:hypothetical protein
MFNNKIINIAAFGLLFYLLYDTNKGTFEKHSSNSMPMEHYSEQSKFTVTIDPDKPPADRSWAEKFVFYMYQDKIQAAKERTAKQQPIIQAGTVFVQKGDKVQISYHFNDMTIPRFGKEGRLEIIAGVANPGVPSSISDLVLGMKKSEIRRIGLPVFELDPRYSGENVILFLDIAIVDTPS